MLAFAYARQHLTNGAKVEGMLRLWEGHSKKGWRGYDCESLPCPCSPVGTRGASRLTPLIPSLLRLSRRRPRVLPPLSTVLGRRGRLSSTMVLSSGMDGECSAMFSLARSPPRAGPGRGRMRLRDPRTADADLLVCLFSFCAWRFGRERKERMTESIEI